MKAETVQEGVSLQDYLIGEQQTEIRHEYINGTPMLWVGQVRLTT
ncbi:MAG: hypothetical protein Q3M24_18550 [Candidatus Electrothrix aestuarii]|uniref:Uncharacterized protein n=1 Tax=Candidatus Electrothrix aestuarii TaxID=3062594 RepID=A0AAU8LTS7_9BACT|nr:hypothetical protein [Candidatus Electrothrix aestuarii]